MEVVVASFVELVEAAVAVDGAGDALFLFEDDSRDDGVVMVSQGRRCCQEVMATFINGAVSIQ